MKVEKKFSGIDQNDIADLLYDHFPGLMAGFYEMQSAFLSARYKVHKSLETSNIIICFIREVHLSIIRQREKNLDHDISLDNFIENLNKITIPTQKIVSVVSKTGIPKETVRRKIKQLMNTGFLLSENKKEYYWKLTTQKRSDFFIKVIKNDINMMAKFAFNISKYLNLNLNEKIIRDEIESEFSFYFYHYLTCQLSWFKMWQDRIKDIDLILITLQALIPTLQFIEKKKDLKQVGIDNLYSILGHANARYEGSNTAISASSISEVTGIPRATCIRKLIKLEKLGMLVRESKTKRYYVNQNSEGRTKYIMTKENVQITVLIFSEFLSIMLNALMRNKKREQFSSTG